MKLIRWLIFPAWLAALSVLLTPSVGTAAEGVAVAIVYDTSGSMKEAVKDSNGKLSPKYVIANRALLAIAGQLQNYNTNGTTDAPHQLEAGLLVFKNNAPSVALPMQRFDQAAFTKWVQGFSNPDGSTPLGNSLESAARAVLASDMAHRHILVITDGENTVGPEPSGILTKVLRDSEKKQIPIGVHFVAFDVDSKVFAGLKKQGATVVSAANETQLNSQLSFILETKILLEAEEPVKK